MNVPMVFEKGNARVHFEDMPKTKDALELILNTRSFQKITITGREIAISTDPSPAYYIRKVLSSKIRAHADELIELSKNILRGIDSE